MRMSPKNGSCRYSMVQWMAMVCALALLSAAVLPMYRAFVIRACETEMLTAMSAVKVAQDEYRAAQSHYVGRRGLYSVAELEDALVPEEGLPELRYVRYDNLLISVGATPAMHYLLVWMLPEVEVLGASPERMAMDEEGGVYRAKKHEQGDWHPSFPHRRQP